VDTTSRRTFFSHVGASLLLAQRAGAAPNLTALRSAPWRVEPGAKELKLERSWSGEFCKPKLVNTGRLPLRVKEVVLFSLPLDLPPDTHLYAESFQMLSQTAGTLGHPVDLGYSEPKHYKIPQPEGVTAASGLLTLTPFTLAFTSCHRFIGRFFLRERSLDVVVDTEGLELEPGQSWDLEEFTLANSPASVAERINRNHAPRGLFPAPPTGWCSWYCFGPRVTAQQVLDNLDRIAKDIPSLKYIQIDDGYQPAMGDWLETGKAFGGEVLGVLKEIRRRGFEPAIWVAPFIAEADSHLFQQHPDWFMKRADGTPLPSAEVTFGGWRRGPWYALDGTHPDAQKHLESLFHTMRHDWGCTYFKLDANFWGAMHGGHFHDAKATRIEAYRRGMQAVLRGAGDSFILGCNHPIWPSFGLIDGSRSSGDIKRTWAVFRTVARQNLSRNWQNGRLWWNDPDAVVLTGNLPEDEFRFHATAVYATGGMTLSGDDLTKIPPDRLAMLRKLLPPTGVAAEFEDDSLRVGVVKLTGKRMVCLFNWGETPQTLSFQLPERSHVLDYWTGEDLGRHEGLFTARDMPPHSARLLSCLSSAPLDIKSFERERVLKAANQYLAEAPITVTASSSLRSAGGPHDFFSEGDYWWPDPKNPAGPYIQRDGMSNPDNFVDHRRYLMRLSVQVPALAAAWKITRDPRYARHAGRHLRAWFVDETTRMSPHLQYSQAIHGRFTGRGTGVIDTVHLVEVARAVEALEGSPAFSKSEAAGIKGWFADYLRWMTTHKYGLEERDAKNNHGTCWVMQAAAFARLTANRELIAYCRNRFRTVLAPDQIAADGSFPLELRRTKPYGYSLFNLDAMSTICQILSTPEENLWTFELPDGRGMRQAMAFMAPYIRDKSKWPKPPDVMYDQEWPMRQCSLLFAGLAFGNTDYIELWRTLKPDSAVEEVIRNFFVRQPVLWVG
jgi:alpha-galactosidase